MNSAEQQLWLKLWLSKHQRELKENNISRDGITISPVTVAAITKISTENLSELDAAEDKDIIRKKIKILESRSDNGIIPPWEEIRLTSSEEDILLDFLMPVDLRRMQLYHNHISFLNNGNNSRDYLNESLKNFKKLLTKIFYSGDSSFDFEQFADFGYFKGDIKEKITGNFSRFKAEVKSLNNDDALAADVRSDIPRNREHDRICNFLSFAFSLQNIKPSEMLIIQTMLDIISKGKYVEYSNNKYKFEYDFKDFYLDKAVKSKNISEEDYWRLMSIARARLGSLFSSNLNVPNFGKVSGGNELSYLSNNTQLHYLENYFDKQLPSEEHIAAVSSYEDMSEDLQFSSNIMPFLEYLTQDRAYLKFKFLHEDFCLHRALHAEDWESYKILLKHGLSEQVIAPPDFCIAEYRGKSIAEILPKANKIIKDLINRIDRMYQFDNHGTLTLIQDNCLHLLKDKSVPCFSMFFSSCVDSRTPLEKIEEFARAVSNISNNQKWRDEPMQKNIMPIINSSLVKVKLASERDSVLQSDSESVVGMKLR
ncbi:MAG: hypothetical protein VX335_04335 [Pseudomonadota bacterium]|nr:hypothetical protein [Pseudomonadota bacterium]